MNYYFENENVYYINAKDARILMQHEKGSNRIVELKVVEFQIGDGNRFPMNLYQNYPADWGNCFGEDWYKNPVDSLSMALITFGFINGFVSNEAKVEALFQLARIKECWEARFILYQMDLIKIKH